MSGYLSIALSVKEHFNDTAGVLVDYMKRTEMLYMERQWDLVAGMAGTFREIRLDF